MNLLLIVYNLCSLPFHFIFIFFYNLYLFFNFHFIGTIIGESAEFFYKYVFYPYFVVYWDGFFDYFGKYSLYSSGYGYVLINQSAYFTDVKEVFYSKKLICLRRKDGDSYLLMVIMICIMDLFLDYCLIEK